MVVRLADVATRAGVSVKTVSNVVNGYVHVAPHTRARVEAAVAELGYRPNLSARNLRGGRSGLIALAVPELGVPYFAELAQHVIRAAAAHGFTVLIDQTDGTPTNERLVLDGIRDHLIDGLIFSPLALGSAELAQRRDTVPMVLLGERVEGGVADHVTIDNIAAAREATVHLADGGRQHIAAIGAQRSVKGETARLRLAGYRQGLKQAGLPYHRTLVASTPAFHRHDGARAMTRLLEHPVPPDAVFAFNDLLALGALRACHQRGVQVPDDVAIVGVDDIDDGAYSTPPLSTIAPDKEQIAQVAVEFLVSRLRGEPPPPARQVTVRHRLVVRASSGGPDPGSMREQQRRRP